MITTSGPLFRADHVGSLLRPPSLLRAGKAREAGSCAAAELRNHEDEAIRTCVMQEAAGLSSTTDGEFGRASWLMDFLYQLRGLEHQGDTLEVEFKNASGPRKLAASHVSVTRRVALDAPIFIDGFQFLASICSSVETAREVWGDA